MKHIEILFSSRNYFWRDPSSQAVQRKKGKRKRHQVHRTPWTFGWHLWDLRKVLQQLAYLTIENRHFYFHSPSSYLFFLQSIQQFTDFNNDLLVLWFKAKVGILKFVWNCQTCWPCQQQPLLTHQIFLILRGSPSITEEQFYMIIPLSNNLSTLLCSVKSYNYKHKTTKKLTKKSLPTICLMAYVKCDQKKIAKCL